MAQREQLFEEQQRFRQTWLMLLLVFVFGGTNALLLWGCYVQLVQGRLWGDTPMGDTGLIVVTAVMLVAGVAISVWFYLMCLETRVFPDRLAVRFRGLLIDRELFWHDIEAFEAVSYRPILEFGGWGVRGFGANRAYNISGNRGVRLHLKGGKRLLLGSQRADALEQAIARASAREPGLQAKDAQE